MRIGGALGIAAPAQLALPQFQVHGIICSEDWIELAAVDGIYHITLDESRRPAAYGFRQLAAGEEIPREFIVSQARNLGNQSRAVRTMQSPHIVLLSDRGGNRYVLEITPAKIDHSDVSSTSQHVLSS